LPVVIALIVIGLPILISFRRVIIFGGQRYLAIALAPLCLGAGLGLHALLHKLLRGKLLAAGAVGVLLAANIVYLDHYYTGREKRMWREAVAFVDANARPADVITTTPGYSLWVVEYYESGELRPVAIDRIPSLEPPPERVWVVSVSPMAVPEERTLTESGWRPVRMQRVVEGSPSSYLRIVRYDRQK